MQLWDYELGIRYMSKLDEFHSFVEKIRKYGLVSSPLDRVSQRLSILLIDDLPVVNGKVSYGRLHRCLHLLLQSVHIPTAILINDYGKSDSAEHHTRYWEELQSSLQNAGAYKVASLPCPVRYYPIVIYGFFINIILSFRLHLIRSLSIPSEKHFPKYAEWNN